MGYLTTAKGNSSVSMGENTNSWGKASTAAGILSYANNEAAVAMGLAANAMGVASISLGNYTYAGADYSTAFGSYSEATGLISFAAGYHARAFGESSISMGYLSRSVKNYSSSIGYYATTELEFSTALGTYAIARGKYGSALGAYTDSRSAYEAVVGSYNTYYTPVSSTTWSANDRIFVVGNGQDESLRSDAMTILKNGRVGIGTSAPSQKLHVSGGNAIINNAFIGDAGHGTTWASFSSTGSVSQTGYALLQSTDGLYTFLNRKSGTGYMGFRIDNVDKMIIDNAGNVGIGITPSQKLDVEGIVKANYLTVDPQDGTNEGGEILLSGAGTNPGIVIDNLSGNIRMHTFSSGKYLQLIGGTIRSEGTGGINYFANTVGIATGNPAYKLHVAGDIFADGGWLRVSGSQGLYFETYQGGWYMTDGTYIRAYNNKNIYTGGNVRTDGNLQVGDGSTLNVINNGNLSYRTNVLFANTSGNVGIGTTNPSTKLHVTPGQVTLNGTDNPYIGLNDGTYQGYLEIVNDFLSLTHNGVRRLVINPILGYVGIGITSPTHILHINGVGRSASSTWVTTSDARVKEDIHSIEGSLEKIIQLNPVSFHYTKEYINNNPSIDGRFYGFLAQEFREVFPESVRITSEKVGDKSIDDLMLLNQGDLLPFMVNAIKEQQQQLDNQLHTIESQNERIARLEKMVEELMGR